jgi:menaquinone-9 beta-reductase
MVKKRKIRTSFLIVGAGPAGLISAILLRRAGHDVTIIEKKTAQERPVCGEYLTPQGVSLFQQLELDHVLAGFRPLEGMTILSPSSQKVDGLFPQKLCGLSVNRKILQERLSEELLSLKGHIFHDQALEAIHRSRDNLIAETPSFIIVAKSLIGADGRQSKVAKLLNFKTGKPFQRRIALHCYLRPISPLPRKGQMHLLTCGSYVGINPISNQEVNFSIVTNTENLKAHEDSRAYINAIIKDRIELRNQFYPLEDEPIKITSPLSRHALEIVRGKVALVGDAAGFIDPLTGEGITAATRMASILAEEISRSSSIQEALLKYSLRRKLEFKEKEKINLLFQQILKRPMTSEIMAWFLKNSPSLRSVFLGVIGNIYTKRQALKEVLNGKNY